MTEKEHRVKLYETDVRRAEIELAEAKVKLNQGYLRAKSEFEEKYEALKFEFQRAQSRLDREKQSLSWAKIEAERGFDLGST